MTMPADPVEDLWSSVLGILSEDPRITPQLHGFLNLVEPKGVLAGTLYLEVPNDLTRGMLEQRIRIPITEAVARIAFRRYRLGQRVIIPGLVNTLMMPALRALPHPVLSPIVSTLLKPRKRS